MLKVIIFWLMAMATLVIVVGGGTWLFFWIYKQIKANKMLDD